MLTLVVLWLFFVVELRWLIWILFGEAFLDGVAVAFLLPSRIRDLPFEGDLAPLDFEDLLVGDLDGFLTAFEGVVLLCGRETVCLAPLYFV